MNDVASSGKISLTFYAWCIYTPWRTFSYGSNFNVGSYGQPTHPSIISWCVECYFHSPDVNMSSFAQVYADLRDELWADVVERPSTTLFSFNWKWLFRLSGAVIYWTVWAIPSERIIAEWFSIWCLNHRQFWLDELEIASPALIVTYNLTFRYMTKLSHHLASSLYLVARYKYLCCTLEEKIPVTIYRCFRT